MRIAILGNSGSGKSMLARWLSDGASLPLLDLDSVAWEPGKVAVPRPAESAQEDVRAFCVEHREWVLEGCYASLIEEALAFSPTLIFLNPGEAQCLDHCRARPWESHKYASMEEQNQRLPCLLDWVSDYYRREGEMSSKAHSELFSAFAGQKTELVDQVDLTRPPAHLLHAIQMGQGQRLD